MYKKMLSLVLAMVLFFSSSAVYASKDVGKNDGVTIFVGYEEEVRSEILKDTSESELTKAIDSISDYAMYLYTEKGIHNQDEIIKCMKDADLGNTVNTLKCYLGNKITIDVVSNRLDYDIINVPTRLNRYETGEETLRVDPDNQIIGSKYYTISGSYPGMKPYRGNYKTIVRGSRTQITSVSTSTISGGEHMQPNDEVRNSRSGRVTFFYKGLIVAYCHINLNSSGGISFSIEG